MAFVGGCALRVERRQRPPERGVATSKRPVWLRERRTISRERVRFGRPHVTPPSWNVAFTPQSTAAFRPRLAFNGRRVLRRRTLVSACGYRIVLTLQRVAEGRSCLDSRWRRLSARLALSVFIGLASFLADRVSHRMNKALLPDDRVSFVLCVGSRLAGHASVLVGEASLRPRLSSLLSGEPRSSLTPPRSSFAKPRSSLAAPRSSLAVSRSRWNKTGHRLRFRRRRENSRACVSTEHGSPISPCFRG